MSHATLGQTNSNGSSSEKHHDLTYTDVFIAYSSTQPTTHYTSSTQSLTVMLSNSVNNYKRTSSVSFVSVHLITSLAQACSCTISLSCHTKPQLQELKPFILFHCTHSVASILLYLHPCLDRQSGTLWLNQAIHQYSFCISPFLQHRPIPRKFSWISHLHQDVRFHLPEVSQC